MSSPVTINPQREIVAPIIAQIRSGQSFLVNKHEAGALTPPINPASGNSFSGINRLILMSSGEADPRWMTKSQAEQQGYIIKDGAEPRKMVHWQFYKKVSIKGQNGEPLRESDGKVKTKTIRLERPELKFYEIYNAGSLAQSNGQDLPAYEPAPEAGDSIARAKTILANSGVEMVHDGAGTAGFYSPDRDQLIMPDTEFRPSSDSEYQALAVNGLCGQICQKRGQAPDDPAWHQSPKYVEQHLQVAVASIYATQDLGLPSRPYGDGPLNPKAMKLWASELEKDPNLLFRACAGAEKIKNHLLGLEREQSHDLQAKEPVKLSVPFAERKEAKELGAYFLTEERLWVSSPDNKNLAELTSRWPHDPEKHQKKGNQEQKAPKRAYLDVPFEEKDQAKDLGAKFDSRRKQWFVEPEKDLSPFIEWLSEKDRKTLPVLSPEEEFAVVLKKAGLVLDGPPVMDGQLHKVRVEGQKKGAAQGLYCLNPDLSQPSFYANHLTGVGGTALYSGQMLSEAKKIELTEELAVKKEELCKTRSAAPQKAIDRQTDNPVKDQDKTQAPDPKKGLGR